MSEHRRPHVDVIIPAFDEEAHIGACLDHVMAQDYPAGLIRVWVVDAGSTDRTVEVVQARQDAEPRLTLIAGHGRLNHGRALNLGLALSDAELVARVDAHMNIAPTYLRRAVERLAGSSPKVAGVGGQATLTGDTRFGAAVGLARSSRFGVAGSIYADRRTFAVVDTVPCGVFRRPALEAVGGFETVFPAGEDEECNWRLRKAGYDLLLDTRLEFTYATRSSWRALFRQHRNYGHSRAYVVARHPDFLRVRHTVPSAFVTTLAGLGLAGLASRRARWALGTTVAAYGTAAAAAGVVATAASDRWLAPYVTASYAAMHLGYGVGMLAGAGSLVGARLGLVAPRTTVTRR